MPVEHVASSASGPISGDAAIASEPAGAASESVVEQVHPQATSVGSSEPEASNNIPGSEVSSPSGLTDSAVTKPAERSDAYEAHHATRALHPSDGQPVETSPRTQSECRGLLPDTQHHKTRSDSATQGKPCVTSTPSDAHDAGHANGTAVAPPSQPGESNPVVGDWFDELD